MNKTTYRRICVCARKWFIVIICSAPMHVGAQAISLYDAVNKAIVNYPRLQQRKSEATAARAHINTINGNRFPSLVLQDQATAGSDNSLQGAYFSMGMIPSTPGSYTTIHNNPNIGNTAISFLKWEFYTFGYYNAQQKEAESQLAVHEANFNGDKYLLTENIISLYLDWLKKYRLLQIQKENMLRMQVMLAAIRSIVLNGLKPGVDSSTASAAYSDARINYLQALDDFNYDRIALGTYTDINETGITPDTSIISSSLPNSTIIPLSDSVNISHPLLEIYEKQYERQLAYSSLISKKYLPRLGLVGAAWVRNSGISPSGVYPTNLEDGMPYSKSNYLFGLTLTYNLFDLKHRHDELVENKYLSDAKRQEMQTQQVSLNTMMQQANSTYSITLEKLKELPVQLTALRQAYGQQLALYRAGLNTLLEVTNAQYMLLQAETNYVIAQDALLQLLFIRAGLSGQLNDFLQHYKK